MPEITAVILAAGLSRRMGMRNKLLLPINGVPMVRHMVDIYQTVSDGPVLVVIGFDTDAIKDSLAGCDVQFIYNGDFADGQQTSVACGLSAADTAANILIGLGDQPRLTGADLQDLLAAHSSADPSRISIPMLGAQRGNPILVPGVLRKRVLADPKSPGCKTFTRAHPEHVQFHALAAPGFYSDVDTPDAYDNLTALNPEEAT